MEHEEKRGEEREKGEDDQRRGKEDEEASGCLFDSSPRRPQYFFSQDRGRDRKKWQVIRSRCISTRIPTRPDRPHDEAEDDGEEEEDGLVILEHALEALVVWPAPSVTASSIGNVSN